MTTTAEEIHLRLENPPPCPRCSGKTLLLARFQHSWKNARGDDVPGLREAVLCPECDRGEATADELLALFAVDDQLGLDNMQAFGELVAAWVESVRRRRVDEALLAEQHEQWLRGEL